MERAEFVAAIKEKYVTNGRGDMAHRYEVYDALFHTGIKLIAYFNSHYNISISVSGGSDSDCIVHLVCTYFPEYLEKCKFVFVNTGLEYDATKRHLCDLEKRYGIEINRIRGMSVVTSCKKYGFPILNKAKAHYLDMYRRRTPKGYYLVFEANEKYMQFRFTERERELARYLDDNDINVSSRCCDESKKKPIHAFHKANHIDLTVTGERKAEGGQRATAHKSCFAEGVHGIDKYMPLFWWSDAVKAAFKEAEGIRYSDCYEVWGLKRTGCVGCQFGKNTAEELELMFQYEPKLFAACMNVFGQAYELTDRFHCRRKKCLPDFMQMTLTGEIDRNSP